MCGIVGVISSTEKNVVSDLVEGLRRLEYRGYDSSGVAVIADGELQRRRRAGKLVNLEANLKEDPIIGKCGIAHTRWATHGVPNDQNAHPHLTEKVAIVHNGIIENYHLLKEQLLEKGIHFSSDTDTEVILHLVEEYLNQGLSPFNAVKETLSVVRGAFAIALLFRDHPDLLIAARFGPPLAIGYGKGEMYVGSDAVALSHLTQQVTFLEDGDIAVLEASTANIYNFKGESVKRSIQQSKLANSSIDKSGFDHFMLKEIHEQPDVIRRTLSEYLNISHTGLHFRPLPFALENVSRLTIVACGTAFYAGMVAKYWFETIARIPVELDIASEFRYRQPPMPKDGVSLFISQSGETADTLAAQAYVRSQGQPSLGIINVANSSLARAVDVTFLTQAGPEIGVASTKAFTTQLCVLAVLALAFAQAKKTISKEEFSQYCRDLSQLPLLIEQALALKDDVADIARSLLESDNVLYIGRGTSYPLALEGALKLKEISYIHAEGFAAGELKHGPIALVEEGVPTVAIAPFDPLFEKTVSNIQEILSRKGPIILLSDEKGHSLFTSQAIKRIVLPTTSSFIAPMIYAIPTQLLAYYTAVLKGTDVDQPRNLAKSVTVE
ncbi:MAG: glutamine--fructose-6-phosphate transaminase (isomerizing) [Candidatus Paracaedimonas acanthamoebae]|uniref:Glutamine--fructose-6-phosphate aminotransferase [isomerizing] n=1 Tax=Candidatus Paracaedimonas acanthamoebae TaxID=244581 RepID=A0A8J7Q0I7_9PROT|nr:glutamine--fructose-6-phosphate transaminase (isomerizing) [Candidatus Paracaedimonas acanthamoebae]